MSRSIATRRGFMFATLYASGLCAAAFLAAGHAYADGDEPMLTITGELSYRQRIALPPQAVAFVELKKGDADDAAQAVAQTRIELGGRQVPISFSLELPRAHLENGASYLLGGGILVGDQVDWHIAEPVSVKTSASHFDVGVLMLSQQQAEQPQATEFSGGKEALAGAWRILKVGDDTLGTDANASLTFDEDGAFSGRLCNSFRGSYTAEGTTISFGQAAATLMACPDPLGRQERALFSAFESAASFNIAENGALNLLDDKGQILISAQR